MPWARGTGHGDRSLQPWCPSASPETGGHTSLEQLRPCVNGDKPIHEEAPCRSSPVPVGPGLGPAPAASQHRIPAPSAPSQCAAPARPEGPAPGPGGDSGSRDPAALPQHPGATAEPPPPPSPRRLLGRSGTNAKAAGHPRSRRGPQGSSRRRRAFDLHFSLSASRCRRPRRTNPGQVGGLPSALLSPCPSKGTVGWNRDGRQRIAGLRNFSYHEMAILYVTRCVL